MWTSTDGREWTRQAQPADSGALLRDIVWTGRAENALYLLIQTQWLNGVYSYVLDRLNLTGLTNLNTISSLPVKQLLNASFSNPVMYFSVSPYTFGDDLYFFSGTYGYPPVRRRPRGDRRSRPHRLPGSFLSSGASFRTSLADASSS